MILRSSAFLLFTIFALAAAYFEDSKGSEPWDNVDSHVFKIIDSWDYEGATIGIMKNGQMVYAQGYGTIDGHTAHPSSTMPVSSISKTITAVAILKMIKDGSLELTDKVFGPEGRLHFLPLIKGRYDQRLKDITIEHLLRNTGGWDETTGPIYDPMMNSIYLHRQWKVPDIKKKLKVNGILNQNDVLRYMMTQPLDFDPGTRVAISNFGYCILGRIIEEIRGESYEEYVQNNILNPAGMWHTRIGPSPTSGAHMSQVLDFNAMLYEAAQFEESGEVDEDTLPLTVFDGEDGSLSLVSPEFLDSALGWYSNVFDISRFFASLDKILSPEILRSMLHRPRRPKPHSPNAWSGIGFRVRDDGSYWQQNDHRGNDVILYHKGLFPGLTKGINGVKEQDEENSVTVVMLLTGNEWMKLEKRVVRLIDDIGQYPLTNNAFVHDLSDSHMFSVNEGRDQIIKYNLGEHHFDAYFNALRMAGYVPTWVHGYEHKHHTSFIVIAKQAYYATELQYQIFHSSNEKGLVKQIKYSTSHGYAVDLVQTFFSSSHNGRIGHIVLLKQDDQKVYKVGIAEPLDSYFEDLDKSTKGGYIPTVQSMALDHKGVPYTDYILVKQDNLERKVPRIFHNLKTAELEETVRKNAQDGYQLDYIDSFTENDQSFFSVIFRMKKDQKWVLQDDIRIDSLQSESNKWESFSYVPKFMVSYKENGTRKFCGFWVKNAVSEKFNP